MNSPTSPLPTDDKADTAISNSGTPLPGTNDHDRERLRRQLDHRFRHSLRSGQLSPLLHLVMRYKLEGGT